MTNYFSFGLDARIGLGFDKRRSSRKWINKLIYGWEGFKKMCCLRAPRLKNIASSFIEDSNTTIFDNSVPSQNALPKDTSIFLFLNARTYAGLQKPVWDKAYTKHPDSFSPQSCRDGLLETMYFKGSFDLGLEQIPCLSGRARKLYQGKGPFTLNFSPPDEPEETRIYMQIDGEYFYAVRPKQARIYLSEVTKSGVSVLVKQ